MIRYLMDTNVLSEAMRQAPDLNVLAFIAQGHRAYVSVVTIHEIHFGLQRMPIGKRRTSMEAMLARIVSEHKGRTLMVGEEVAWVAADMRAEMQGAGRALTPIDAFIAATAAVYDLDLATRNTGDFELLGLRLINPWQRR